MYKFIWIIGNMGSGKSTVCEELKKVLSHKHFNIDTYRHKFNQDHSMDGENLARDEFFKDLLYTNEILLESIGTYGEDLLYRFTQEEILVIKLFTSREEAISRLENRISNKNIKPLTPFPYIKEERSIETYMKSWDHWQYRINTFYVADPALEINTETSDLNETLKNILEKINEKR